MQRDAPRCNGHVATRLECVGEDTLDDGGLLAHRYEQLVIHPYSTTRRTNNANGAQHHDHANARRRPVCMQHARHTGRTHEAKPQKRNKQTNKQANKQASKQANKQTQQAHATCNVRTAHSRSGRVRSSASATRPLSSICAARTRALGSTASQPLLRLYVRLIGCAMRCVNARCCAACGMLHAAQFASIAIHCVRRRGSTSARAQRCCEATQTHGTENAQTRLRRSHPCRTAVNSACARAQPSRPFRAQSSRGSRRP